MPRRFQDSNAALSGTLGQRSLEEMPDDAEPAIGRRFAPTRWQIRPYGLAHFCSPYRSLTAAATKALRPYRPGARPWPAHQIGNVFGSMRTRITGWP